MMEVIPYKSLGQILLGETREVVRRKLGGEFVEFRKSSDDENFTDAFNDKGLHLYYDSDDRLEFIEVSSPANVCFEGIEFLDRDIIDVVSDMTRLGLKVEESDETYIFPQAGLSLFVPDEYVETVSIFRKGYYDFLGIP